MTITEVSDLTRLSPTTIHRAIRLRHLGVVRIGRALRVRQTDLEAWLNRNARHAR
jgi:excisionase family DNA binding protein